MTATKRVVNGFLDEQIVEHQQSLVKASAASMLSLCSRKLQVKLSKNNLFLNPLGRHSLKRRLTFLPILS
jgi:hypothetical protein